VLMANQSGGSLKEPPAPAAAPQTAGASVPAGATGIATASPGASPPTSREGSSAAPGAPTPPVPSGIAQANATTLAAAAPAPAAPAAGGAAPAAAGAKPDGKKVYEQTCAVCHGAGIAGAPKLGDKAAWAPRIAQGVNVLYQHALQGYQGKSGVMPPKGGNTALADADVRAAVDHMAASGR